MACALGGRIAFRLGPLVRRDDLCTLVCNDIKTISIEMLRSCCDNYAEGNRVKGHEEDVGSRDMVSLRL